MAWIGKALTLWLLAVAGFGCGLGLAAQSQPPDFELGARQADTGLRVSQDLQVDLLLHDPLVANPLYLQFDERGRMWLVEYRQYPWPAGLKLVSRDNVWRNVYDPPFAPPPPHAADSPFRGRDRISIHSDTDGDGTFDKHQVFLDGLNLATAALPGRGGVFVMNPPYLLFYADGDQDGVPDSEQPRILLSGFGIEDTHSIANSLRWGPDGWVYGTHGSTVSASIVRHGEDNQPLANESPIHTMGQFVWRYHPERHLYEVFAEGGGNAFGIEFDSAGRVYSGHNGGDTRGFYYVQGGYYLKNFGKHGSHSNPFTFGYYPAMKAPPVERFTHTFEIYEGEALPERYRGKLFGAAPHTHYIVASELFADGSGRQSRDLGKVVAAGDQPKDDWFSPVEIQTGPDGNLYVADWYAVQVNHYKGHEGETNPEMGRVYRMRSPGGAADTRIDLKVASNPELVEKWLVHPNRWQRETALRLLAERKAQDVTPQLKKLFASDDERDALNGLWGLYQMGSFGREVALSALRHPTQNVRAWGVRLLGDEASFGSTLISDPEIVNRLRELAVVEPIVEVRLQIACTARRVPTRLGLELIGSLLTHAADADDVFLPQAIWWGVEALADDRAAVIEWSRVTDHWNSRVASKANLFPNLVRRYAMIGTQADLEACAKVMAAAPTSEQREELVGGFLQAYQGRTLPQLPDGLLEELSRVKGPFATLLGLRRGSAEALQKVLSEIGNPSVAESERVEYIQTLGEVRGGGAEAVSRLLAMLSDKPSDAIAAAVLDALQNYAEPTIGTELLARYEALSPGIRPTVLSVLASREAWAGQLLDAVSAGKVRAEELPAELVQRMRLLPGEQIVTRLGELFPKAAEDEVELDARAEQIAAILQQGRGNPLAGQELFHGAASCGKCHRMFGRGGDIGPDLTSYNRSMVKLMLTAVTKPSAEIREGYETLTVATVDGRVVSGFRIEENDEVLVLRTAEGQTLTIARDDLEEQAPGKLSLMPSGLLDKLTDAQIRDLFAFLTSTTPPLLP
jgi:putative heme-binding domain-containing protein